MAAVFLGDERGWAQAEAVRLLDNLIGKFFGLVEMRSDRADRAARNAAALFVPCHRVLRLDGSLGGFRWGLPVKRWLLDHEA